MDEKLKVLVVDDEQIVLDSVRKHLRKEPYDVTTVLTTQDALRILDEDRVDIVLTDLMMPEMDGLELTKYIKDRFPIVPVIMITGFATINTALQATQLGAFDYVAKPFTKVELKGVVTRAAEVVSAAHAESTNSQDEQMKLDGGDKPSFQLVGEHTWIMMERAGTILIGVEHSFVTMVGRIQTVYLPKVGDHLRQGGVYFQLFSTDMRSHSVLSPLSGEVKEVNQFVQDDPSTALQDPYEKGWLIRIIPEKFEEERKVLGL